MATIVQGLEETQEECVAILRWCCIVSVMIETASLEAVVDDATQNAIGFRDDAFDADNLAFVLSSIPRQNPNDAWHVIDSARDYPRVELLRQQLLDKLLRLSPTSNLGFVHVLYRAPDGVQAWHRDITENDVAAAGYAKGRFRVGFNIRGGGLMEYQNPAGDKHDHVIKPGTIYVIDNSHNPRHAMSPSSRDGVAFRSGHVLLMTDVAYYSEFRQSS